LITVSHKTFTDIRQSGSQVVTRDRRTDKCRVLYGRHLSLSLHVAYRMPILGSCLYLSSCLSFFSSFFYFRIPETCEDGCKVQNDCFLEVESPLEYTFLGS